MSYGQKKTDFPAKKSCQESIIGLHGWHFDVMQAAAGVGHKKSMACAMLSCLIMCGLQSQPPECRISRSLRVC